MCPFGHRPSQALCRGRVVKMSPSGSSEGDEASWVVPARNRSLLRPKHSPRRSPRPAPTTTRARTASSTAPMTAAISCGVGIASSTPRQPWPRRAVSQPESRPRPPKLQALADPAPRASSRRKAASRSPELPRRGSGEWSGEARWLFGRLLVRYRFPTRPRPTGGRSGGTPRCRHPCRAPTSVPRRRRRSCRRARRERLVTRFQMTASRRCVTTTETAVTLALSILQLNRLGVPWIASGIGTLRPCPNARTNAQSTASSATRCSSASRSARRTGYLPRSAWPRLRVGAGPFGQQPVPGASGQS